MVPFSKKKLANGILLGWVKCPSFSAHSYVNGPMLSLPTLLFLKMGEIWQKLLEDSRVLQYHIEQKQIDFKTWYSLKAIRLWEAFCREIFAHMLFNKIFCLVHVPPVTFVCLNDAINLFFSVLFFKFVPLSLFNASLRFFLSEGWTSFLTWTITIIPTYSFKHSVAVSTNASTQFVSIFFVLVI